MGVEYEHWMVDLHRGLAWGLGICGKPHGEQFDVYE